MIPISALVFIVIFVVGCFATIFIDAWFGILLYIFDYFLNPPGRWWGDSIPDMRYAFIVGVITLGSFTVRMRKYADNKIFSVPQTKWLFLFVIIMVATWPIAIDQYHHEFFLTIVVKYVLFYYLIVKCIDTPDKFEKLIGVFLLGQFYLGWYAYQVGRSGEGRLEQLGGSDSQDANAAAAIIVVSIPILINYLITGKKWQKVSSLIALAFILNALILVNSRGAFVALVVSIGYYFLLSFKTPSFPKFKKKNILAVAFAGFALFLFLADPIFLDRMTTITDTEVEEREGYSGRERVDYWMKTFEMLEDYPYGTGAWGYQAVSSIYLPPEAMNSKTGTRAVHSMYFEVLAEYGYHGAIVFLLFILSSFLYLKKLKWSLKKSGMYGPYSMATALEAGYLAVLIAGVFISTLYLEIIYWMAAFSAAYGNIYFKKIKQIESGITETEVVT